MTQGSGATFDPETIILLKKVLAEAERAADATQIIRGEGKIGDRHP
jgi:hypothetical protein